MRAQPSWMTQSDVLVLELLAKTELELPPKPIHVNLVEIADVSHEVVKRSCRKLSNAGLLERTESGKGYVRITDRGLKWYAGEITRAELETRSPDVKISE